MIESLRYVITAAGMGLVARYSMFVVQKAFPKVKDDLAYILSCVVAVVVALGAYSLLPIIPRLPPEVAAIFYPTLCWAANYIWFRFGPKA